MIEIEKKSVVPIYGLMVVWVLYCVIFPLDSILSFVGLASAGLIAYGVFSLIFPGKTISINATEKPKSTGDEKVDTLLTEGEKSVAEMRGMSAAITDDAIKQKANELISVTDSIFKKLLIEPDVYTQVKRFADFFLPTTVKLLCSYVRFSQSGVDGENITSTLERISNALDTTLVSYRKFYDSLFETQALDIETDIDVLDTMLKKEGLLDSDFDAKNS
ncbi:MAG: 5-bromo-4-chloroindolyl phosphate hydrolysis family protein [Oscillospiraceae bacterium]|nr:5-bromo-4-chloroindolyl phosphate hydrolysis family protein [Oscillospiraceae bacterium]